MYKLSEVAKRLGICTASVRKLCDTGVLASVRPCGPNGHRRVPEKELERYLRNLSSNSGQLGQDLTETLRQVKELV